MSTKTIREYLPTTTLGFISSRRSKNGLSSTSLTTYGARKPSKNRVTKWESFERSLAHDLWTSNIFFWTWNVLLPNWTDDNEFSICSSLIATGNVVFKPDFKNSVASTLSAKQQKLHQVSVCNTFTLIILAN